MMSDADPLAHAASKADLSSDALAAVRHWLTELLTAEEFAKLGQGGHTENQVPLRRVFVDLPVAEQDALRTGHGRSRPLFLERLLLAGPTDLRAACNQYRQRSLALGDTPPALADASEMGIDQVTRSRTRRPEFSTVLLIGGPGQGKSTLCQLACQLHRAALLKPIEHTLGLSHRELLHTLDPASSSDVFSNVTFTPSLPLKVSLPDFAAWLGRSGAAGDTDLSLLEFIASLPSARQSKLSAHMLLALVRTMPSLLLLDGFDEIGARQDRERVAASARALISMIAERNSAAQVVATTRPQGYAGELAHIGVELTEWYLVPLTRDEALRYADKLVQAKISGVDLQSTVLTRLKEAAAEPSTERLLTTPLQVTIMTALVQQGRAPRERWKLFWSYFDYTYKREIERDTYASRLLAEHRSHIEAIHARTALILQVEAERDGGAAARIPQDRLATVVNEVLAEDEIDDQQRQTLVQQIIIAAEQRLVFLVEPEPGSFGFEIRSLQEFMAAWALTHGREADVEIRLKQIVDAPMFRNVFLFVASRLFSEASPLRDVLADPVCASLDASDELATIAKPGSLLALEILEEGAVLSQPKRARALMEQAIRLLDLPPGKEHSRLARIANPDTAEILERTVESRISNEVKRNNPSRYAAWACLLEAADSGAPWARNMVQRNWSDLGTPISLWARASQIAGPLGAWIAPVIDSLADRLSPDEFVQVLDLSGDSQQGSPISNWSCWLAAIFQSVRANRRRQRFPGMFGPLAPIQAIRVPADTIQSPMPTAWEAWGATARYELNPGPDTLGAALGTVAKALAPSSWRALADNSSWPMSACLLSASSVADIQRFAKAALSGELGGSDEWKAAQEGWSRRGSKIKRFDSVHLPWSRSSLTDFPPLVFWHSRSLLGRNQEGQLSTVRSLAAAFSRAEGQAVQRRLGTMCLELLRHLPESTRIDDDELMSWVEAVPDSIRHLVPRPVSLAVDQWIRVLHAIERQSSAHYSFVDLYDALGALVESHGSGPVLRLVVLSLCTVGSNDDSLGGRVSPSFRDAILSVLQRLPELEASARAQVAIVRFLVDGRRPSAAQIVEEIRGPAERDPLLWSALLGAVALGAVPREHQGPILSKVYAALDKSWYFAREPVETARRLLQARRSELDDVAVWNRLGLPAPLPKRPSSENRGDSESPEPVALTTIELTDVRCFKDLKIDLVEPAADRGQWIVLLGPNGAGKTTILRSLALGLRKVGDPRIWPKGAFSDGWQRIAAAGEPLTTEARIAVTLRDGIVRETWLRSSESTLIYQTPEMRETRTFPILAYGCRRGSALGGASREVTLGEDDGPEIATLFSEDAALIHAETWLLQWEGDVQKSERSREIYGAITSALCEVLDLQSVEVRERRLWATQQNNVQVPFSALSDGMLTSAGWLIDVVARWIEWAERRGWHIDRSFLDKMTGLVLIDEIDLHLHPRRQIEIVGHVRNLMPRLSFVVTTHNPLTLVGAKADEIWVLDTDGGTPSVIRGTELPMLLTGGEIYKRYFGIEDIYPSDVGRKLQRYTFLSSYGLRSDAEETEMRALERELQSSGVAPEWQIVPRTSDTEGGNRSRKRKRDKTRES